MAPVDEDGPQRPRGRRGSGEDTRALILAAAEREFAERGYADASLRGIARRAGVDPALVRYWFDGGKAELFSSVMSRGTVNPVQLVQAVLAGPEESRGTRIVLAVLGAWDRPEAAERIRLIFGAASTGPGEDAVRDFLTEEVFARIARTVPGPDALLRIQLVASHVAGLMFARHVLRLEPLASTPLENLAAMAGPVLQRYLDAPTSDGPDPSAEGTAALYSPHEE